MPKAFHWHGHTMLTWHYLIALRGLMIFGIVALFFGFIAVARALRVAVAWLLGAHVRHPRRVTLDERLTHAHHR